MRVLHVLCRNFVSEMKEEYKSHFGLKSQSPMEISGGLICLARQWWIHVPCAHVWPYHDSDFSCRGVHIYIHLQVRCNLLVSEHVRLKVNLHTALSCRSLHIPLSISLVHMCVLHEIKACILCTVCEPSVMPVSLLCVHPALHQLQLKLQLECATSSLAGVGASASIVAVTVMYSPGVVYLNVSMACLCHLVGTLSCAGGHICCQAPRV